MDSGERTSTGGNRPVVMDPSQAIVAAAPSPRGRRRRKIWKIRVTTIDPKKYAGFLRTLDNPFADTDPAQRVEDILSFCARLWARTCQDIERRRLASRDARGDIPGS